MKDFDVATVSAQTYAKFGPRGLGEMDWGRSEIDPKRPFDVEDYGVVLLRLKSGRSITLEVGWACFQANDSREFGLDLLGANAGLSLYPLKLYRNTLEGQEVLQFNAAKPALPEDRIHHFVHSILDGKKILVLPEESLKVQQILDAIYDSARGNKEIKLT